MPKLGRGRKIGEEEGWEERQEKKKEERKGILQEKRGKDWIGIPIVWFYCICKLSIIDKILISLEKQAYLIRKREREKERKGGREEGRKGGVEEKDIITYIQKIKEFIWRIACNDLCKILPFHISNI